MQTDCIFLNVKLHLLPIVFSGEDVFTSSRLDCPPVIAPSVRAGKRGCWKCEGDCTERTRQTVYARNAVR